MFSRKRYSYFSELNQFEKQIKTKKKISVIIQYLILKKIKLTIQYTLIKKKTKQVRTSHSGLVLTAGVLRAKSKFLYHLKKPCCQKCKKLYLQKLPAVVIFKGAQLVFNACK